MKQPQILFVWKGSGVFNSDFSQIVRLIYCLRINKPSCKSTDSSALHLDILYNGFLRMNPVYDCFSYTQLGEWTRSSLCSFKIPTKSLFPNILSNEEPYLVHPSPLSTQTEAVLSRSSPLVVLVYSFNVSGDAIFWERPGHHFQSSGCLLPKY